MYGQPDSLVSGLALLMSQNMSATLLKTKTGKTYSLISVLLLEYISMIYESKAALTQPTMTRLSQKHHLTACTACTAWCAHNSNVVLHLYHRFVCKGHLEYEQVCLHAEFIEDKNKSDSVWRIITMLQVVWFVVDTIARATQGLAMTTLELSTIAYVWCTIGIFFFWRNRPKDVSLPVMVVPEHTMSEIVVQAGSAAADSYIYTPLDFVSGSIHHWTMYWSCWFDILHRMGCTFHTRKRPVDKIHDDSFHEMSPSLDAVLVLVQLGFAAIHVAGWNFLFPTETGALLWRVCTIYIIAAMFFYWLIDSYTFQLHPLLQQYWRSVTNKKKKMMVQMDEEKQASVFRVRMQDLAERLRNNSPDKDPTLRVPLKALIPITIIAAIYRLAHGFVVLEDLINLREVPASAFDTVDWTVWISHI